MSGEYDAKYAKNDWTRWARYHGIKPPSITPREPTKRPPKRFGKEAIEVFEKKLSMSIGDHLEVYGCMPIWACSYASRPDEPILTERRHKKLAGYVLDQRESGIDINPEVFQSGGYYIQSSDDDYEKLLSMGVWYVEKEFFQSREKRMLTFRFMNGDGHVNSVATARWTRGKDRKSIRKETLSIDGVWEAVECPSTDLDIKSHGVGKIILSL